MSLAQTTAVVASVAETAGQGIARSLLGIANLIAGSAENIRANKQIALALSRRTNELITTLAALLENQDAAQATAAKVWQASLVHFQALLSEVQEGLHEQERRSYLAQILHQERDRERLDDLAQRVQDAFNVLMLQINMNITQAVHGIVAPLETTTAFDQLKSMHKAFVSVAGSSPQVALPQPPSVFFGRGKEVQAAVGVIVAPSAGHLVILGGPGMGKTTLALSVLHHPNVVSRFSSRRYFVPCDASEGTSTCVNILGGAFGISSSDPKVVRKRLSGLLSEDRALLVLDNFESAWEASEQRREAEDVLGFLSSIEGVSVVVTLRGSERPQGVPWTRPFLPPLEPLDDTAATQTFLTISDASEHDKSLKKLLGNLENVPLALVLMANLAQFDPLDALLAQWAAVSTSMLKRGAGGHRLNALDVSIALSLMSPRIKAVPDALKLLSLLALLPRGVIDTDIRHWASDLSSRALSALLQAALAYRTSEQRVHVLAPIRAFILGQYTPSDDILRPLCTHYFDLAAVLVSNSRTGSRPKAIAAVAPELENLAFIIQFALKQSRSAEEAVKATVQLCMMYHSTTLGPGPDLVSDALKVARDSGFEELTADLLYHWATMCYNSSLSGNAPELYEEARSIYERIGSVDGVLDTSTRLIIYMDDAEASIVEGKRLWELAVSRNDPQRAAACCHKIGDQCQGSGRHDEAISWYDRAVTTIRETNEAADRVVGYSMWQTASSFRDMGRIKEAIALYEKALPYVEAVENTFGICVVFSSLGEIYLSQGYWQRTVENMELALKAGAMEYRFNVTLLRSLVLAYLMGDDEPGAMRTLALLESLRVPTIPVRNVHILLARLETAIWHGALDEAQVELDFALSALPTYLPKPGKFVWANCHLLRVRGRLELAREQPERAFPCFLVVAIASRNTGALADVLLALALLAEAVDDVLAVLLLDAVMLGLLRNGWESLLGDALLRSAKIARNRGDIQNAAHRAKSALLHFTETSYARGQERARSFLAELGRSVDWLA